MTTTTTSDRHGGPVTAGSAVRGRRRGTGTGIPRVVAVGVVVAVLLGGAVAWALAVGLRTFDVETPSMGRAAPVGTLVVTMPLRGADPSVGDVITFVPPVAATGGRPTTYTHRVETVERGRITTRGDANGATDAWVIGSEDVIGRAVAVLPGLGWVVRAAPWVAVGTALVWLTTAAVRGRPLRTALRLFGVVAVVAGVVAVLKPFVAVTLLATEGGSRPVASVVSTGMLPIRVSTAAGDGVRLVSGQVGSVPLPPGTEGAVQLAARLDLSPVGWVVFAAVCLLPVAVAVAVARAPGRRRGRDDAATPDRRRVQDDQATPDAPTVVVDAADVGLVADFEGRR